LEGSLVQVSIVFSMIVALIITTPSAPAALAGSRFPLYRLDVVQRVVKKLLVLLGRHDFQEVCVLLGDACVAGWQVVEVAGADHFFALGVLDAEASFQNVSKRSPSAVPGTGRPAGL
jgi:cytochrome c biogenesis protein CcdA